MKKGITVVLVLNFISVQLFPQKNQSDAYSSKIDSIFTAYAKHDLLSGSFLVAEKNKITFSKGYNLANRELKTPITKETVFRIASVSKPVTAAAILLLEERGLLSTTDKLSKYIPDYPKGDSITIHHLLTHTSGIKDAFKLPFFTDSVICSPVTIDNLIKTFKDVPLEFSPGSRFRYSNSGYIILSYIIQQVSGKPFDSFIINNIFKPSGMANSGMFYTSAKKQAVGYTVNVNGISETIKPHESVLLGAGAFYSTTGDLFKFCSALLSNRLLKKETIAKMLTPYTKEGYGYGWFIKEENGNKTIWHQGGISGFSAYMQYSFANEILIVGLKNNDRLVLLPEQSVIESVVFQKPYELPIIFEETKVEVNILQQYAGEYEIAPNAQIRLSVIDGNLVLKTPDGSSYRLYPSTNTLFFLKVMDVQCEILLGEKKEVKGLNWIQKGRKRFAARS